ncbi:MAG TPA: cyclase [Acidobacteriota bacterium]|nr:cyclase [Acidobacteriota bacterium]
MSHMLIRHRVHDFDKWKVAYDSHRQVRAAAGLKDLRLWRNVDDPREIFLLFEAADVAKAKAFAKSAELKERMTAAGVIGPPDISFLSA